MNKERLMNVLLSPSVTEKSSRVGDMGQVVFKVIKDASKPEIKKAVELLFNVEVDAVRVSNVKSKAKRFGQVQGRRQGWKKAYVSLKEGHDISFANADK